MSDERRERVAHAIWQRRLDNDDPDTHSLAWEEAIASPSIWVAHEVQEVRRDAETAIDVLASDGAMTGQGT
jgi:hypothetical protein